MEQKPELVSHLAEWRDSKRDCVSNELRYSWNKAILVNECFYAGLNTCSSALNFLSQTCMTYNISAVWIGSEDRIYSSGRNFSCNLCMLGTPVLFLLKGWCSLGGCWLRSRQGHSRTVCNRNNSLNPGLHGFKFWVNYRGEKQKIMFHHYLPRLSEWHRNGDRSHRMFPVPEGERKSFPNLIKNITCIRFPPVRILFLIFIYIVSFFQESQNNGAVEILV